MDENPYKSPEPERKPSQVNWLEWLQLMGVAACVGVAIGAKWMGLVTSEQTMAMIDIIVLLAVIVLSRGKLHRPNLK